MKTNLFHPKNKSKVLSVAVLAITIATIASGTLAYFNAEETAHNVITSGGISIEIVEVGEDGKPFPKEGISGVMPGRTITKKVTIQNQDENSSNTAWVRAKIGVDITLKEDAQGEVNDGLIVLDIDTEKWQAQGEWYYYTEKLPVEGETMPLFTTVSFHENMDNKYQNCTVTIDVYAEAVQADNNGTIWSDAAGWPTAEPATAE